MAGVVAEDSAMQRPLPMPSYRKSRRWTESEARAALAALRASQLSIRAFALREGLDVQRLYVWRRKLGASVAASPMSPPPFVELLPSVPDRIEVVLRSGRVVRCAAEIELSTLRRLLGVLEEEPAC
jgi:transposase-like protein